MTDEPLLHPKNDELIAFGLGKLESGEATKIEVHLSECEACCETLLDLKDDTFVELVRKSPEPEAVGGRNEHEETEETEETEYAAAGSIAVEFTDEATPNDESCHTATMLVQSGSVVDSMDLPNELQKHLRYKVVAQIGQGGMGAVYRAQHRLMNRPVALKLINSQLVKHPQAVERFRREVQAAAQLAHPNIVAAYDAEQAGDVHFLVMEFVEGTDLSAVVHRRGPLPVGEACEYVRQAALGLQHAHEKCMIHRDIKPHNLMLSPDGQVRILDFGLAGFATEEAFLDSEETPESDGDTTPLHLTMMGSVMGTPDYIAPEQARDAHSADIRADIYSLGCTLHFLLSGKPVFEARSVVDKLKAHATADLPKLDDSRDDVPPELQGVLDRMLAKDPAERFQTPTEVAEALAALLAPQPAPTIASDKPPAGRKAATAILAGCIMLLFGVILVLTTQGNFEVRSDLDGIQVMVSKNGEEFRVLDVNSGTSVFWLPSEEFQITAKGNVDVSVSQKHVRVTWMGRQAIEITRGPRTRLPNGGTSQDNTATNVPSLELACMLIGHTDSVASIDISSDGRLAVSSSHDRTMRLWDVKTGKCLHVFGTRIYAGHVDISPDDCYAAVGSPGANVRIWNLTTREVYRTLTAGNGGVRGLAFSPDSRFILAVNDDGSARYWDVENEKVIHSFTLDSEFKFYAGTQISGDGRLGVVRPFSRTKDSTVYLFDLHVGELLRKLKVTDEGLGTGHIALSRDARSLLVPGRAREATVYDLEKGTERQISANGSVVSFLPDDHHTAWGGKDGVVSVADIRTGKLIATSINHKYPIGGMSVAPNGRVILAGHSRFSHMPAPNKETLEEDFAIRVWRLSENLWPALPPAGRSWNRLTSRTGILTNPPTLPDGGLPTGKNLIIDSSLEGTPLRRLPKTWSAWLDDGPDFTCEVMDGGVNGKHCLRISGKGTRGVVFATSIPMDRTRRYALKGRVKIEGDADTWAVIKLNYFNRTGWLGVDDRVGVTSGESDWQFFEKTDRAAAFPEATLIVPTCHIEGNGTAWFDDIEVTAYDRDKLPEDFDRKHGKNNRKYSLE